MSGNHAGETPGELVLPEAAARMFAALDRRWTLQVLFLLCQRPARFTELQTRIPRISANSLNHRLQELIRLELATRHTDPGPPLRSTYQATHTGALLGTHLHSMVDLAQRHELFTQPA